MARHAQARTTRHLGMRRGGRLPIRFGRLRRFLLPVSVVTVVSLLPVAPSLASNDGPTPGTSIPAHGSNPAYDVALAAQKFARTNYPSVFGGVTLSQRASHVNIYLTDLLPSVELAIEQGASPKLFSFILTPTSEEQLNAMNTRIATDVANGTLRNLGLTVAYNMPNITSGKVTLAIVDPSVSASSLLTSRYGSNVALVAVPASQAVLKSDDRQNDTNPFNGGDFISDEVTGDCTSGFPVHGGGFYYLLTAAHCYAVGTPIYNEAASYGGGYGNGAYMGQITQRDQSFGGLDVEIDGTGSSTLLYTGTYGNTQRATISGVASNIVGEQICTDGAFDGTDCGPVIQSINGCGVIDQAVGGNRYVCGLVTATSSGSTIAAGAGDSGGPVYLFSGSDLLGLGTITGGAGPVVSCIYFIPRGNCTTGVIYTDLSAELGEFGGLAVN